MRKFQIYTMWIPALILTVVMVACGDPDKNPGGSTGPLSSPTVVTVLPAGASTPCTNTVVAVTFSKPMNPQTVNAQTFTVTPGVSGPITADPTNTIFTLTPSVALTADIQYTVTITAGAQSDTGVPATSFTSTFTPVTCTPPSGLGAACGFGILGATPVVSNVPAVGTIVTDGDVGISPAASITGFPPGVIVNGTLQPNTSAAIAAQSAMTTAYAAALNAGGGPTAGTALPAMIGTGAAPPRASLAPGIYVTTSTLLIVGDVTLNGSAGSTWIIKVGSALTTAAGTTGSTPNSRVLLTGGASPDGVTWVIGSSATLGTMSLFQGSILADASITLGHGAQLNGRALVRAVPDGGAVTMDDNAVNVPSCP